MTFCTWRVKSTSWRIWCIVAGLIRVAGAALAAATACGEASRPFGAVTSEASRGAPGDTVGICIGFRGGGGGLGGIPCAGRTGGGSGTAGIGGGCHVGTLLGGAWAG